MSQQFEQLNASHMAFIQRQHMFFVATAMAEGRVNLSPKGMGSLVIEDERKLLWLNVTGSGNETSAHVQSNGRMTMMFCAFEGKPLILRVYGQAQVIHPADEAWGWLIRRFPELPGARQIFSLDIELVQTSCGMSIPFFDFVGEREQLNDWAAAKGEDGIRDYWAQKNALSIDGVPTHIVQKSTP